MKQNTTPRDEEEYRLALGQHIRELRKQKNLGQEAFADLARIHRNHIGLLEHGKLDPRLSTLRQVAQALEIPLDELLASLRVKLESKG